MSLTLKLASLAIRTLAKPVGNRIKLRAREHDTFRAFFVNFAQRLHRVDMRMRLGILHDPAAQDRMYAREAAEAATKKKQAETPTVRTQPDQQPHQAPPNDQEDKDKSKRKDKPSTPFIRPLSEARAIELGANFASESFIFIVAAGLIVFERWWSKRKENKKDEHLADRIKTLEDQTANLSTLEDEVRRLHAKTVEYERALGGRPATVAAREVGRAQAV